MNKCRLIIIVFISILLIGCAPSVNTNMEEDLPEKTIVLNQFFISFVGMTQDTLFEDIKGSDHLHYSELIKNTDGTISITGTVSQFNEFVNYKKQNINDAQVEFETIHDGYKIEVNDNFTEINYYFNLDLDNASIALYILQIAHYAAYCQVFSGNNGEEDLKMQLNIYNSDTGKLVVSQDINNPSEYLFTEEDWERSYE